MTSFLGCHFFCIGHISKLHAELLQYSLKSGFLSTELTIAISVSLYALQRFPMLGAGIMPLLFY